MFGFGSKFAVLESKFGIYEDLSKEMLDKLERAVNTISDNSNKIAIILERHEAKISEGDKTYSIILKMIEDMKERNTAEHIEVEQKIDILDKKIQDLSKFRWQVGGVLVVASIILGSLTTGFISNLVPNALTSPSSSASIVEKS